MTEVRRTYYGIPRRLARDYLIGLGGTATDPDRKEGDEIEGDGWRAVLTDGPPMSHGTIELNRVDVCVFGVAPALDRIVEKFTLRMRRGGG